MRRTQQRKILKVKQEGITLIALVITIIILLILAGVTIAALSGDNGILKNVAKAKEETKQAEEDELRRLTALEAATNLEQTTHTDNSMGEEKERTVTIPAGFAVSKVDGENTIAEGLVIIDSSGNEYVWIPVDGVLDEDGTIADVTGSEKKILLGRYDFESDGMPSKYISTSTGVTEDTLVLHNPNLRNAIATDIEAFIQSVRENHGYYIARYEAGVTGYDVNNIQTSNSNSESSWTGYSEESKGSIKLVSKSEEQVWNYITQNKASELCEDLYTGVNSDLVNSYAWDTAILFIQKYGQKNYSRQNGHSINSSKQLTGLSGDVQLNIYDMAGNCTEWTTETANHVNSPCVDRGGNYNDSNFCSSSRGSNGTAYAVIFYSFRPILYL